MTRPDFIRYGKGRSPMVVIKCPDCGWRPIPAEAFNRLPRRRANGTGLTDVDVVQCRCGAWVPHQEATR